MRAIFLECNMPFWVDVARALERDHGWQISLWCTPLIEMEVREAFPDSVVYNSLDAIRGIHCEAYGDGPCLDRPTLDRYAGCEIRALKMFERLDGGAGFGYPDRARHYHRVLRYWLGIFYTLDPQVVVFPTAPHIGYDYVVYEICKQRGVRTIFFDRTQALGLLLLTHRLEDGPPGLAEAHAALADAPIQLSPSTEERLAKISGSYEEGIPFGLELKLAREAKSQGFSYLRTLASAVRRGVPESYDKLPGRPLHDRHQLPPVEYARLRRRAAHAVQIRKQAYEQLTQAPDYSRPYLFFALQVQPEKSTSPDGDVFAHQYLIVEMLAASVPDGWQIYVKEHPSQFRQYKPGDRSAKTADFYQQLASIPNVRLIPLSVTSFELIDGAKACAVTTGSVGIESLVRGKPVLLFGWAWYRGCPHVYPTQERAALEAALAEIEAGVEVPLDDLRRYLMAAEQVGFWGYVDPVYALRDDVSEADNVAGIVRLIAGS